jgi:tetratricopeptide (TPR) repeat protein
MTAGSMVLGARRDPGAPSAPFTLDIFGGKARVGLSGLSAGPVRVENIELDILGLEFPFDLAKLRSELPDRRSSLARLRASAGDRHLNALVEGDLRISVLPGRLFVHGPLPGGGRVVIELVEEPGGSGDHVSLQVATALRVGAELAAASGARDALSPLLREAIREGRLRLPVVRWVCARALAPMGWRLPVSEPGNVSRLVLWEGQVLLEVSQGEQSPAIDVDATAPDETMLRSAQRRRAMTALREAAREAEAGDRNGAIQHVQRQLASGAADVPAICTCATAYLPVEAVARMGSAAPDSFLCRAIEGDAAMGRGDAEAAAEAWLVAARLADPEKEPVFALELMCAALEALAGSLREGEELPSAAIDMVVRLSRRIPDDPEISRLLVRLHTSLPFDLRIQAVRARLFSQQPEPEDMDAALSLVVEAAELGRSSEAADLVLMVARLGVGDPAALALCAGSLERVERADQAAGLWKKAADLAGAQGDEALRLACALRLDPGLARGEVGAVQRALDAGAGEHNGALVALLDAAERYPELCTEALLDAALARLAGRTTGELTRALRRAAARSREPLVAGRVLDALVRTGRASVSDVWAADVSRWPEPVARDAVRGARALLAVAERAGLSAAGAEEEGSSRVSLAAAHALLGRLLHGRYGRAADAVPYLRAAWEHDRACAEAARELMRALVENAGFDEAQDVAAETVLLLEDPEEQVAIGKTLLGALPAASRLGDRLRNALREACRAVPWESALVVRLDSSEEEEVGPTAPPSTETEGHAEDAESPVGELLETTQADLVQARALLSRGDFSGAAARVESALARHPDFPAALLLASQVAEAGGRYGEASDHLLRRIEWVFDAAEARPMQVHALDLLVAADLPERARAELERWLEHDPSWAESLETRLGRLLKKGSSALSVGHLTRGE